MATVIDNRPFYETYGKLANYFSLPFNIVMGSDILIDLHIYPTFSAIGNASIYAFVKNI